MYSHKIMKKASCLLILFLISIIGCKKFVEIDPPITELVTASVFNNASSATSAQTVIYSKMSSNNESYNLEQNTGLLADELANYSGSSLNLAFYHNAMTAALGPGPWTNAYGYIYDCNAILEALQNNTAIKPVITQQLTGESKFLRAFWYFYLANIYGDVPLLTSTDYKINATISRTPRAQVYQQIITDLTDAKNSLSANYVDATDTIATIDRVRPNKFAAAALLARTYLYLGKYDSAEAHATSVINNSLYSLPSLDNAFLKNSSEAIWQLMIPLPSSTNATPDGNKFILISASNNVGISSFLLNSFEANDLRYTKWIGKYPTTPNPATTYYYTNKYKVRSQTTAPTEYTMVLRLAEQYLIRAEARAMQNETAGAIADLNAIRSRAGLPNYAGATDKASLLTAILHERQVELFTEWGHRWFDLIRTNSVDSVMGRVAPLKGGTWSLDGHQKLYPIYYYEILSDPNLTQTPGY